MPSSNFISCSIHTRASQSPLAELNSTPSSSSGAPLVVYITIPQNSCVDADYGIDDVPYVIKWSIQPDALEESGLVVQVEVDGCQRGQPRCYEKRPGEHGNRQPIVGEDDGVWAVADGSRRRPWVWSPVKTTHPHAALSDKDILAKVGSVRVTFTRATVVPTSVVIPAVPVFSGGAPLPKRMLSKVSHWTKLGYIERRPTPEDVGLAVDDYSDVLATFIFHYKSQHLMQHLFSSSPEVKVSFPNDDSPESGSLRSTKSKSKSFEFTRLRSSSPIQPPTDMNSVGEKKQWFGMAKAKRVMSTSSIPQSREENQVEVEASKENLERPKRNRTMSLKVGKRVGLLSKNSNSPRTSFDGNDKKTVEIQPIVQDDLNTFEGLKNEVIRLRLELEALKLDMKLSNSSNTIEFEQPTRKAGLHEQSISEETSTSQ